MSASEPLYKPHPILSEFSFPLVQGEDYERFKADIKDNGQQDPIVIYEDAILDGCTRYRICTDLGIEPLGRYFEGSHEEARAFVISANVHRRHLTAEWLRARIEGLIKANPEKSDRKIAEEAKTNHKAVGRARKKLESTGTVSQLDKRVGADGKARRQPAKEPTSSTVQPAEAAIEPKPKQLTSAEKRAIKKEEAALESLRQAAKDLADRKAAATAVAVEIRVRIGITNFVWLATKLAGDIWEVIDRTDAIGDLAKSVSLPAAAPPAPVASDTHQLDLLPLIAAPIEAPDESPEQAPTEPISGSDPGEMPELLRRAPDQTPRVPPAPHPAN